MSESRLEKLLAIRETLLKQALSEYALAEKHNLDASQALEELQSNALQGLMRGETAGMNLYEQAIRLNYKAREKSETEMVEKRRHVQAKQQEKNKIEKLIEHEAAKHKQIAVAKEQKEQDAWALRMRRTV